MRQPCMWLYWMGVVGELTEGHCGGSEGDNSGRSPGQAGVTGLFSPKSRAVCSLQAKPTPDPQSYVSRKPGELRSVWPEWPVISPPLLGDPGTGQQCATRLSPRCLWLQP